MRRRWPILGLVSALACASLFILALSDASAATRYVDGNIASTCSGSTYSIASRNCSGSDGTGYKTIQEGLAALSTSTSCDVLLIRSGSYTKSGVYGNLAADTYGGGCGSSWGTATIISNYPGETYTFTNDGINMDHSVSTGGISWIIFSCDSMVRCNFRGSGGAGQSGIRLNNAAHHVRFQRISVRNFTDQGMQGGTGGCPSGPTNIEILDSDISLNGDDNSHFEHGIYPSCSADWIVARNVLLGNMGYGIHFYSSSTDWHMRATVDSNYVEGRKTGATGTAYGIVIATGSGHKAYNNIVNGQGAQAVKFTGCFQFYGAQTSPLLYNNTCHDVTTGIENNSGVSGLESKNNIFSSVSSIITDAGSGTVQSNNLCPSAGTGCSVTGSPSFTNAGSGDFSLQSGSTARDAGSDLSATLTTDIIGTTRPQNGIFDIGAYEYLVSISGGFVGRGSKGLAGMN